MSVRRVRIEEGLSLALHARTVISRTDTGYLLSSPDNCVAVKADIDGAIAAETAAMLVERGLLLPPGSTLFEQPALCRAVFTWDTAIEVNGLDDVLAEARNTRGLDVGCGYGRLLLPLAERGYVLDGIDASLPLLTQLREDVGERGVDLRLYRADMESFASPGTYGYAFAAMNTLRYLERRWQVAAHFRAMATSVVPGGLYAICTSLTSDPTDPWTREWEIEWKGRPASVTWRNCEYHHLSGRSIEQVVVRWLDTDDVAHDELQGQGNFTLAQLTAAAGDAWELEGTWDTTFQSLTPDTADHDTYWVCLRRRRA